MSSFSQSGARGLERLIWLKYYYVQKWQITFALGPNAAKNIDYEEKSFEQKLFRIKFLQETK